MVQGSHLNEVPGPMERGPPRDGTSDREGQAEIHHAIRIRQNGSALAIFIGIGLKTKNILDRRRDIS